MDRRPDYDTRDKPDPRCAYACSTQRGADEIKRLRIIIENNATAWDDIRVAAAQSAAHLRAQNSQGVKGTGLARAPTPEPVR